MITSTYIQDSTSTLKLYPVKSSYISPNTITSGFKLLNDRLDSTGGTIEAIIYHDLTSVVSGYVFGRESVSSPYKTQALYLNSVKTQYQLYWGTGVGNTTAVINVSTLTDSNFYRVTITWNGTNHSMKFNKVTKVANVITYGPDINSNNGVSGSEFGTFDIGVLTGGYSTGALNNGSKHKMVSFKVFANDHTTLTASFNFSEGGGTKVYNCITGAEYQLYNVTESLIWNNKQDFNHYNFEHGFTLLQKSGSLDIRVPNKHVDNSEIVVTPPSGYSRIENVGPCGTVFNGCESLFKLDDVSATEVYKPFVANSGVTGMDGFYTYVADNEGLPYYDNDAGFRLVYSGGYWWLATIPFVAIFRCVPLSYPVPYGISYMDAVTSEPSTLTITNELFSSASPLYTSDPDHILFTDGTGVAKECNMSTMVTNIGYNRGYMYYNYLNYTNFLLYSNNNILTNDVKIIKYVGLGDKIVYDESNQVVYDEASHTVLSEVILPS